MPEATEHSTPSQIASRAVERHAADQVPDAVRSAEVVSDIISADIPPREILEAIDSLGDMTGMDTRAIKREIVIAASKRRFQKNIGRYSLQAQRYGKATKR